MFYDQDEFNIRFEWGVDGTEALMERADVIIIVDILSFSTSVEIAVSRGGVVFPYAGEMTFLNDFATQVDANPVNKKRTLDQNSLSPASLRNLQNGARIILPSLNGSKLSAMVHGKTTIAGCFRNASAVAQAAQNIGQKICIIAAGEKWKNGNLRFSFEDLIGAGAIISRLSGKKSPEAISCQNAYLPIAHQLEQFLSKCSSGRELIEAGFGQDVKLAAELDCSSTVPILINGAFQAN